MGSELIVEFLKLVMAQAAHKLAQTASVQTPDVVKLHL